MSDAVSQAQLKATLWAQPGAHVHAVIDGMVMPGLAQRLAQADVAGWDCLQRGALSTEQAEQAAYLVELRADSAYTDLLLGEAVGTYPGWGLLLVSRHALLPVREHCRALSTVTVPDGERRPWRWYDPQVLGAILPALQPSQLDLLFELEQSFVMVSKTDWTWHSLRNGLLNTDRRALLPPAR